MSTNRLKVAAVPLLVTLLLLAAGKASAGLPPMNMPVGVTEISREVFGLHMLILWICVIIGVVVFGAMILSIVFFRKSRGAVAAKWHESTSVEIVWTVVPFLILIGMAIPATATLVKMEDTRGADMTVKITGYQWNWHYDYMDRDIAFFSNLDVDSNRAYQLGSDLRPADVENYLLDVDRPLVIPVGTRVRFLLTANDVIHAWWVPDFALKKDAIPGFINEMWVNVDEPGIYRGQCAELCGRGHAFMPIVVVAMEPEDFEAWVAEQKGEETAATVVPAADGIQVVSIGSLAGLTAAAAGSDDMAGLMERGQAINDRQCATCHRKDGRGMGMFPALVGSDMVLNDLQRHIEVVVNGVPGTGMAAFGGRLDDAELAAVITYQRNAWGNDTGDVVTPSDIRAAR